MRTVDIDGISTLRGRAAALNADNMISLSNPDSKQIRVYDDVTVRFLAEDICAGPALCTDA
ncbi:MAG: hypothetical protein IJQ02_02970 [Oscillospiraceae bacterium]|nr:hypothetical protein [Oscillospiraceae bacterium]